MTTDQIPRSELTLSKFLKYHRTKQFGQYFDFDELKDSSVSLNNRHVVFYHPNGTVFEDTSGNPCKVAFYVPSHRSVSGLAIRVGDANHSQQYVRIPTHEKASPNIGALLGDKAIPFRHLKELGIEYLTITAFFIDPRAEPVNRPVRDDRTPFGLLLRY